MNTTEFKINLMNTVYEVILTKYSLSNKIQGMRRIKNDTNHIKKYTLSKY